MADVTKCAICGKLPEASVHHEVGGHQFKRIEVFRSVQPSGYKVWLFLAAAAAVAAIALAVARAL